jgi:branched-chain amino acid transport system permease protein
MNFWLVQAINGISYGMLLFLLAAGLSLVFGLMNIINLAHGSYYMLGTYIGITVYRYSQNFFLAVVGAAIGLAIVGVLMQRFILRRLYGNHLGQVLLTFGFVFIIADISLLVWGGYAQNMPPPSFFKGATTTGGVTFPTYRLLVIGVGLLVALFLCWFQKGTKMGVAVRAAVDDEEMSQSIGLNVPLTTTVVFGISTALAAVGGVIGGPIIGAYPGVEHEVLLLALVVVIIGGLGSLRGAFVGSILVGLLDNFGKALFPELSLFTIFAPMAIILAIRPNGLFGRAL